MDKIKKAFVLFVTFLFVSSIVVSTFGAVLADDFDDPRWGEICSTVDGYKDNKSKCDAYEKHLRNKQNETNSKIDELKKDVSKLSGDIQKDEAMLKTIDTQIESLEVRIRESKKEIASLEVKIDDLQVDIVETEASIEEKHEVASKYMLNIQSTTRINVFIDFLLGGEDFSEISRRVEGMNLINEKNQENIRELNAEKVVLEEKKEELDFEKAYMADVLEEQVASVNEQKELKTLAEERVIVLRNAYQEVVDKRNAAQQEAKVMGEKIASIGPIESSSGNMLRPIGSGFYVSASVWNYSGGSKHLGIDLAASRGTSIVAPANGVVIATNTGCPTEGSLSSSCGSGYGNYVVMIVYNDGKAYGALYGHMQSGGVLVSRGQQISRGQTIGRVGNSGTSTGAHLHAELFYLGQKNVDQAYDAWYNGPRNIQFGLGGSTSPNEYNNRCDIKGYVENCRINPSNYWGLYVGNSR